MTWLDNLEARAPDPVSAFRNIEAGKFISVRREVRRRTQVGSAPAIAPQLAALAEALDAIVARLPDEAFAAPGGEGDWNVAEAIGHTAHAALPGPFQVDRGYLREEFVQHQERVEPLVLPAAERTAQFHAGTVRGGHGFDCRTQPPRPSMARPRSMMFDFLCTVRQRPPHGRPADGPRVIVRVEKPGALRFARSVGVEIERLPGDFN